MATLNRSVIVVKPKQPFLDWLHTADPTSHELTLRNLVLEPTIYLIPSVTQELRSNKPCASCVSGSSVSN